MRLKSKIAAVVTVSIFGVVFCAATAMAGGNNYGTSWESWLFGAKVNGYVQIQASYNDGGLHARQGYQRFTRDAGPSLDTGRLYTSTAASASDSSVYSRTDSVWDSILWGDSYVTHYNYGFIYF